MNKFSKKLLNSKLLNNQTKSFSSINITLPKYETSELDAKLLPTKTTTTKEELLDYLYQFSVMRRMEIESDTLYKNKEIRGFCHLYMGQEAIALGMHEGTTFDDPLITAYREHCQALTRGDNPYAIIAEMMSRHTGSTKGKGGSMHYYNKKNNFYGGNGIVGAQIPLGAGLAFALKYKNKKNAAFAMYGDGSANQGQLFESANMAGLWKLPLVFVIENNHYAMGTSESRGNYYKPLMAKFRGYAGLLVDGMDVFACREATKFAKNYAIENGPIFLEFNTYRYQGHSMSDPGVTYRTKDEVTQVRKSVDPIDKVKNLLLDNKFATEKEIKEVERKVRDEIEKGVKQALSDPYPPMDEMYKDIYVKGDESFIRGIEYEDSIFNNSKV